ncbi:MAG: hypothetical protein AAB965_03855 [Patescibacteria group bacterium]
MLTLQKTFLALSLLSFVVFANYASAGWMAPTSPPSGAPLSSGNTELPINIGTITQTKSAGLILGNVEAVTARINRVGIGITPNSTLPGRMSVAGDTKARRFCLGSFPSRTNGCISIWQEASGLSGGVANSLAKWLTSDTLGVSGIFESANIISIGASSAKKNVSINGSLNIGATPSGNSGLIIRGFSSLTATELSALQARGIALSVDTEGNIILVQACNITP